MGQPRNYTTPPCATLVKTDAKGDRSITALNIQSVKNLTSKASVENSK